MASESNIIHVEPINDLIDHLDEDCPCGPTTEAVFREDGSNGWVVIHHSLDGREHRETDHACEPCPLCASRNG